MDGTQQNATKCNTFNTFFSPAQVRVTEEVPRATVCLLIITIRPRRDVGNVSSGCWILRRRAKLQGVTAPSEWSLRGLVRAIHRTKSAS